MCGIPLFKAYKTKLKMASASDMIASVVLANEHTTVGAASPFLVGHFEYFIAIAFVFLGHALRAE